MRGQGTEHGWGRPRWAWALIGVVATAACAHAGATHAFVPMGPFRLGPDDLIEVSVYQSPDLSRTIPVRPDGEISLPLVGDVDVGGLTPEQARVRIAERFRKWVNDPSDVAVIVHEVHSTSIYVTGEVMKPGMFPIYGTTTVLQAIALAGGLGEFSARNTATVVRAGTGQKIVVSVADPSDAGTLVLHPGDTVVVH